MPGTNETSPRSRMLIAMSRRPWNVILRVLQIVFLVPILWVGVGGYTIIVVFESYMADVPGPFLWAAILVIVPLIASQIGVWLTRGDRWAKTRLVCLDVRRVFLRVTYALIAVGLLVIITVDFLVQRGWTVLLAVDGALLICVSYLLLRSREAVQV